MKIIIGYVYLASLHSLRNHASLACMLLYVTDNNYVLCTDSNNIGEELDQEPVEPVEYLPSLHDITECVYVRHFGPYGGNISCPDTAAALTTIQTKRVGLVTV